MRVGSLADRMEALVTSPCFMGSGGRGRGGADGRWYDWPKGSIFRKIRPYFVKALFPEIRPSNEKK